MATAKSQRIFIWVIAIVMSVGTLGAYFVTILANQNGAVPSTQDAALQKQYEEYLKQQAACPSDSTQPVQAVSPPPVPPAIKPVESVPVLKTEDVTVGSGDEIKTGDCVELFFHGVLAKDGKAFQGGDNYASGKPYRSLTTGFVPGFSKGLIGMKVGGERKIYIPSAEAYGAQAQGEIPANSDLIFAVRITAKYKKQ